MGNKGKNHVVGSSSSSSSPPPNKNNNNNNINNNNGDNNKGKQPQRGLGVAQLERIRLESQLANLGFNPYYAFPYPPPTRFQEQMRAQAAYHQAALLATATPPPFAYASSSSSGSSALFDYNNQLARLLIEKGAEIGKTGTLTLGDESNPSMYFRWNPNVIVRAENQLPNMSTKPLLTTLEETTRMEHFLRTNGSIINQNAESSNADEEIDLELKL